MDREILLTGIGGQGVQLAAKMLALAGMGEGREVMQFSMFGGTMRGGSSECTVVLADAPVEAPPVVPHAWAAIAMHANAVDAIERKLRPGGPVLYNRTAIPAPPAREDCTWVPIDAARLAAECGNVAGQSLIALGAFCALTELVEPGSLEDALERLLPAYRQHTLETNRACLRAGARAIADLAGSAPAWRIAAAGDRPAAGSSGSSHEPAASPSRNG
jgi:2-oxoglutarate ferredoxin oxidoreductase subunit gamma